MDLEHINRERRKRGLPPLTRQQAQTAVESHSANNGRDSSMDFLIGFSTGVMMPSPGGVVGAVIHNSTTYDPSPSCDTGHSSHDSGSSSSFDSGGPCDSGGSFGGDGGGSF